MSDPCDAMRDRVLAVVNRFKKAKEVRKHPLFRDLDLCDADGWEPIRPEVLKAYQDMAARIEEAIATPEPISGVALASPPAQETTIEEHRLEIYKPTETIHD